ncbi:hypothetical protein AOB46_16405 [Chryseobacterium indologenes]|uniref:C1q domain-containing protein n=2 Tax=Chryseobacterium indologenes TaxID=253 RepID=A0A0N0IUY0_CHRID|nr:hypothetical protein AOB46_16405 [Chryseobacterium indologenes]
MKKHYHFLNIVNKLINRKAMVCLLLSVSYGHAMAQLGSVGIGTDNPHPSAILDITASDKGLMLPVVSLTSAADKITVPNPKVGFVIYNKSIAGTGKNAVKKGPYVYNGTAWELMWTKAESKAEVPKIPFVKPVFAASNTNISATFAAGSSNLLTFNTLYRDEPAGALGQGATYNRYLIQERGVYIITYAVEIRANTAAVGTTTFQILKNGTPVHKFISSKDQLAAFAGASNTFATNLEVGDSISFQLIFSGSAYRIVTPNVSIRKISNQ